MRLACRNFAAAATGLSWTVVFALVCWVVFAVAGAAQGGAAAGPLVREGMTTDAVIPPDPAPLRAMDQVLMAGATGFLHQFDPDHVFSESQQLLWTNYATGVTVPVPALGQVRAPVPWIPAGGDNVAVTARASVNPPGDVSVLDVVTGIWQHWVLPAGDVVRAVSGRSALVIATVNGTQVWQMLTFDDSGSPVVAPVTGLPAGASPDPRWQLGAVDGKAIAVGYITNGVEQYGLLDLSTAEMTPIPGAISIPIALTPGHVAFYDSSTEQVQVYSRAGLLDGSDTTPQVVTLPGASGNYAVTLTGNHLLAAPDPFGLGSYAPVLDIPLSGGAAGTALASAQTGYGSLVQAPGGSALVIGGSGQADWSVRRLAASTSDHLTDTVVLPLTAPMTDAGLTITQGLVRHIEGEPVPDGPSVPRIYDHGIPALGGAHAPLGTGVLISAIPCSADGSCVRTIDGNENGTSYIATEAFGRPGPLVIQTDFGDGGVLSSFGSTGGALVDASMRYVIVDGSDPDRQYVFDATSRKVLTSPSRSPGRPCGLTLCGVATVPDGCKPPTWIQARKPRQSRPVPHARPARFKQPPGGSTGRAGHKARQGSTTRKQESASPFPRGRCCSATATSSCATQRPAA